MAGPPDLFVVCKNCHAEVSPYITECPYCGHRLRKRAPKLEKGGTPRPPRRASRRKPARPRLPPLRSGELPGLGGTPGRPYSTIALVVVALIVTIAGRASLSREAIENRDLDTVPFAFDLVAGPSADVWQRSATAPFMYLESSGYAAVALLCIFLFGWLLERRHGHLVPLLVFVVAGMGGMWLAALVEPDGTIFAGGNGAALGLLGAWVVPELLARRRGEDMVWDGLGVLVITLVLLLLPLTTMFANPIAGAAGGLAGLLIGLVLARLPRR